LKQLLIGQTRKLVIQVLLRLDPPTSHRDSRGALMKRKPNTSMAVCCYLAFTVAQSAQAQSGQRVQRSEPSSSRCTILADYGPVWVRVYEEEGDGGKAWMVYDGKLDRGGKHVITSGTERIRYYYKTAENDEMHGNIGAWCCKGNTIRVP
jgi:hypothetical protein